MEMREKWIMGVKLQEESEEIFKILCFWLKKVMMIICNNLTNLWTRNTKLDALNKGNSPKGETVI